MQFLSVLEDSNAEMRKAAHNLLSTIELPSISSFKATVRAFMAGLEHHPEVRTFPPLHVRAIEDCRSELKCALLSVLVGFSECNTESNKLGPETW